MKLKLTAAALTASLMGTPANAALTIVFEALDTPDGVTGGFTAELTNLPITFGIIPAAQISECHTDSGPDCDASTMVYVDTAPINFPADIYDAIMFASPSHSIFRFTNGAFNTPGVYDTVAGFTNIGRMTISGSVDGPPVDWNPPPIRPCDDPDGCGPVGGPSGAPEPGVWAVMLLGFGLSGMALRARRRFRPA